MAQPLWFLLLSRAELQLKCKVAGFQRSHIPLDAAVPCSDLADLLPGSVRSRGKGTRSNSNSRGRKVESHEIGGVGSERHL